MGRRRSAIVENLRKYYYSGYREEALFGYIHRTEAGNAIIKRARLSEVTRISEGGVYLESGDVIPIHRVVEIVTLKGEILWRRGRTTGL